MDTGILEILVNKREETNWMVTRGDSTAKVLALFTQLCFVFRGNVSVNASGL